MAESELGAVELGVDIACSHEELDGCAYAPLLVDVARVSEGDFGIGVGMYAEVGDVVGAVAYTFLGQREECLGDAGVDVGVDVDADCVEASESAESGRQDAEFDVGSEPVVVLEAVEEFAGGTAGFMTWWCVR